MKTIVVALLCVASLVAAGDHSPRHRRHVVLPAAGPPGPPGPAGGGTANETVFSYIKWTTGGGPQGFDVYSVGGRKLSTVFFTTLLGIGDGISSQFGVNFGTTDPNLSQLDLANNLNLDVLRGMVIRTPYSLAARTFVVTVRLDGFDNLAPGLGVNGTLHVILYATNNTNQPLLFSATPYSISVPVSQENAFPLYITRLIRTRET